MGIMLSTPITTKESSDGIGDVLSYGQSAMQGWRMQMEDAQCSAINFDRKLSFFGVFDGHGGNEVSAYVARHIIDKIKESEAYKDKQYDKCLIDAYLQLDVDMETEEGCKELGTYSKNQSGQPLKPDMVGCTAVSCIYDDETKQLYVANAGDSRIVLCKKGEAVPLSVDHKPALESESSRIAAAGGYIVNGRVNGNLNLCRSIGDQEYKQNAELPPEKQIITAYPDTKIIPIDDDCEFILIGCDGMWDVLSNDEAVEFVGQKLAELPKDGKLSSICETVVDRCCAKDSNEIVGCDNISFTLVVFNKNVKWGTTPVVEKADTEMKEENKEEEAK